MAEDEATDDWRRLKACPGCEYSLETLPAEGTCPECGRTYDQKYIVLTGHGRGKWDTVAGGTWRGVVWQVVGIGAILWMFTNGRRGFGNLQFLVIGVVAAVVLAAQLYARLFSAREPGMQLWVSPEGVAQVPSTPEARLARSIGDWTTLLFVPLLYLAFVAGDGRQAGWVVLAPFTVVMAGVWGMRWALRTRTQITGAAGGAPRLWGWGEIERIKVNALSGERARVCCLVTRKWWRITLREEWVVDIEIACPAKVAEGLGRRMVEWCPKVGGARA